MTEAKVSSNSFNYAWKDASRLLWLWLIKPAAALTEIGARYEAQLLAAFSLVFAVFVSIGALSSISANSGAEESGIALTLIAIVALVAYILSRTRYYNIGSWLLIWGLAITAYILAFFSDDPTVSLLSMLPLAYALGSALLPVPILSLLVVLSSMGVFLMPLLSPEIFTSAEAGTAAGILIVLGVILSIVAGFREMVERLRFVEISNVNLELRELSDQQERRVLERTQELVLASEVSRTFAQNLELDQLLKIAVEQIQSAFNLYYAQIYLFYPRQRSLVLRAGSGAVGGELLERGHRLAVDEASLNGTAASRRRVVIVEDVRNNISFRPNSLLPDTRSEAAIPMVLGDRLIGVLELQSSQPDSFRSEGILALEAIASQLAIAVENAELFAQIREARSEAETRMRSQTRQGWLDFLDAIHKSEQFSYVYEDGSIRSSVATASPSDAPVALEMPIKVSGEVVGRLAFQSEPARPLGPEQVELVEGVAAQVGMQIENLRLLAQAERYRLEAEETNRRLTRQGWEEYQKDLQDGLAYVYDQSQVFAEGERPLSVMDVGASHPLVVQDTPIGVLEFEGNQPLNGDDLALVQKVAGSLSAHIDNLRLTAQSQVALSNLETLNEVTRSASRMLEFEVVTSEILDHILGVAGFGAGLISIEDLATRRLRLVTHRNLPEAMVTKLTSVGLEGTPCDVVYQSGDTVIVSDLERLPEDLHATNLADDFVRQAMQRPLAMGFHSYLGVALTAKGQVVGTVCLFDQGNKSINPANLELVDSIGQQVGVLVDNVRSYQGTQKALAQTETLYNAIAEMNQAESYNDILSAMASHTMLGRADQLLMMGVLDRPLGGGAQPEWIYPVAWRSEQPVQIERRYPAMMMTGMMGSGTDEHKVSAIGGLDTHSPMMQAIQGLFNLDQPAASLYSMPLTLGGQVIGFVLGLFSQKSEPNTEEDQQLKAVAGQAAIAVESRLLLEQAQEKARQEQRLREVSANVYAASDVDSVLRRAVEQVGRTLGTQAYIYLGNGKGTNGESPGNGAHDGEGLPEQPELAKM